jgi:TldD protein
MYLFHKGLYTDVRIEETFETIIAYSKGTLEESKVRKYRAAFIRVFNGKLWHYSATSNLQSVQSEIDRLSRMASPDRNIANNSVVKAFETNKGSFVKFGGSSVKDIAKDEKDGLVRSFFPLLEARSGIKLWKIIYLDSSKLVRFFSSKGADLEFDRQRAGLSISMSFSDEGKLFNERFQKAFETFEPLKGLENEFTEYADRCESFLKEAVPVTPGKYTVILSPLAAGVFAHESFGHKSEADFMVGDDTMKREWAIGKKVASGILSIADSGSLPGSGYTPFDDEGTAAKTNYLIKDGILSGRLHSAGTAALLGESPTGNARAVGFEYEPIVRMTTTYILPGSKTRHELFSEVDDGLFVDTIKHGSGMSTFTIAPSLAYRIRSGKIAEPVNISVITGSVFETLSEIDGLSDELELFSFVTGGCGKMEQYPLPVGFGGPYVRVRNMNVQ